MNLTQDQKLAKQRIVAFVSDQGIKEKYFTLSGKGGTGKTFVIGKALEDIVKKHADINPSNIICATISHSAKNVLQESIGNKYDVVTIASLLNMQIDYEDNGQIKFVPPSAKSKPAPIANSEIKIIVIDECSMVTKELFGLIMSMKNHKAKVIAMGDHCQLPPVGEEQGSPFLRHIGSDLSIDIFDNKEDKIQLYDELTEILRYKGPVIELGEKIREQVEICIRDDVYDKHVVNKYTQRIDNVVDGSGYKFYNNPTTFIQTAAIDFARNITDPMHCVMIAYTNKTVNTFNTLIRRQLYGNNLPKFVEGELIINNGGYNFGSNSNDEYEKIFNGEVFRVKDTYYEPFGPDNIPSIVLTLHNTHFKNNIFIVDPAKGLPMYYAKLNELKTYALKDRKQWGAFYAFKNQFAYFDYAYARTTHKCQGQTLNNVYIHEEEIMNHTKLSIKEKFQSLYVAITRARNVANIFNKQYRINN
jgi:ATP-dependent exoDNAse (exonuclease V) alpha subunit